jgi:hypothetical protein
VTVNTHMFLFGLKSGEISMYSKNCVTRHRTASTNDGLPEISKMKFRNRIPEPGTTISGFADSIYIKKKKIPSLTKIRVE